MHVCGAYGEWIKALHFRTRKNTRYMIEKTLMASNKYNNWHASWQKHRTSNSKQRTSQQGQAGGDFEQREVNTCTQTQGVSPHLCSLSQVLLRWCQQFVRNSPPRSSPFILWLIMVLPIPCKVSFLIISQCCVWAKRFFFFCLSFSPRLREGLNEAFYVLPCPSRHYMFDMSWFVRD